MSLVAIMVVVNLSQFMDPLCEDQFRNCKRHWCTEFASLLFSVTFPRPSRYCPRLEMTDLWCTTFLHWMALNICQESHYPCLQTITILAWQLPKRNAESEVLRYSKWYAQGLKTKTTAQNTWHLGGKKESLTICLYYLRGGKSVLKCI